MINSEGGNMAVHRRFINNGRSTNNAIPNIPVTPIVSKMISNLPNDTMKDNLNIFQGKRDVIADLYKKKNESTQVFDSDLAYMAIMSYEIENPINDNPHINDDFFENLPPAPEIAENEISAIFGKNELPPPPLNDNLNSEIISEEDLVKDYFLQKPKNNHCKQATQTYKRDLFRRNTISDFDLLHNWNGDLSEKIRSNQFLDDNYNSNDLLKCFSINGNLNNISESQETFSTNLESNFSLNRSESIKSIISIESQASFGSDFSEYSDISEIKGSDPFVKISPYKIMNDIKEKFPFKNGLDDIVFLVNDYNILKQKHYQKHSMDSEVMGGPAIIMRAFENVKFTFKDVQILNKLCDLCHKKGLNTNEIEKNPYGPKAPFIAKSSFQALRSFAAFQLAEKKYPNSNEMAKRIKEAGQLMNPSPLRKLANFFRKIFGIKY